MKYNVGMYGGSFDPLHLGHINVIIKGASICKKFHIFIFYNETTDYIKKELKYRWILNSTKHLTNIEIHLIKEEGEKEYDENLWKKDADKIKKIIGEPIDAVICGSDYINTGIFETLYEDSEIIYFDRNEVPISSTTIRHNPLKYWEFIPKVAKSYFTKKILIIGSESTGKSTLVENLASYYNTNFVAEIGRETSDIAGGEDKILYEDLLENLIRQKEEVIKGIKFSNKLLFVDTDALTTNFYSEVLLDDLNQKENIKNLSKLINWSNDWDLVLFLDIDGVPFVQDGTRNEEFKMEREKYSSQLKEMFDENNVTYEIIKGNYLERFEQAKTIINEKFELK